MITHKKTECGYSIYISTLFYQYVREPYNIKV